MRPLHPFFAHPLVAASLTLGLLGNAVHVQAQTSLRYVQGTEIDTLDPAVSRSTPSQIVMAHIFNRLVNWDGPGFKKIVPELAESWSVSPDGKVWTFNLRKDVKFHDGTPFDAAAVKFNLDRLRSAELASPNRSYYAAIDAVETPSAYVVTITTKEPSPTLLEVLAGNWSFISSPAAIEKRGRAYGRNPVGTGPYMFKDWVPNERAELVRNPAYFGTPGKTDRLVFRPVPENAARVIELKAGNADVAANVAPELAAEFKGNDKILLQQEPSSFQVFFELNVTKPPFDDVRVRKAVNLAIDRKAIVEKILLGYGRPPNSPFPVGTQGRRAFHPYQYSPDESRRLLKEVFPSGYSGVVTMWTPSGRYTKDRAVAEAVQGYLNAIGLKTDFKVWEWASYQKALYRPEPGKGTGKGSSDANMWLLGTGVPMADIRLRRKLATNDPSNLTGFSNPMVDGLLTKASIEMDYKKRMDAYGEIQRIAWELDPSTIPLFDQVQLIGVRKGVKGLSIYSDESIQFHNAISGR
ncbi:glutathione ABC transporter substrate-binding protein [Comamonas sp. MYb21]|uniref:glutathione ABC transporter substrate-binding protein n=1 Tax=Comamonas sp. MYb21 TaxID=1848648 RepID=UPI0030B2A656